MRVATYGPRFDLIVYHLILCIAPMEWFLDLLLSQISRPFLIWASRSASDLTRNENVCQQAVHQAVDHSQKRDLFS